MERMLTWRRDALRGGCRRAKRPALLDTRVGKGALARAYQLQISEDTPGRDAFFSLP
jgi:hypothetical protein